MRERSDSSKVLRFSATPDSSRGHGPVSAMRVPPSSCAISRSSRRSGSSPRRSRQATEATDQRLTKALTLQPLGGSVFGHAEGEQHAGAGGAPQQPAAVVYRQSLAIALQAIGKLVRPFHWRRTEIKAGAHQRSRLPQRYPLRVADAGKARRRGDHAAHIRFPNAEVDPPVRLEPDRADQHFELLFEPRAHRVIGEPAVIIIEYDTVAAKNTSNGTASANTSRP